MKKIKNSFCIVLLFSILLISGFSSCRTTKTQKSLRPVYITNTKKINLLPADDCLVFIDGVQLLTGAFGETAFSLMSYSQIDKEKINLALFNDLGTDMGSLVFDGGQVIFESPYFPSNLPGEYIIADIQNAFYDFEELKKNYNSAKLIFEETVQEDLETKRRCIYDGAKLIEEIHISKTEITVTNLLRGYNYSLILAE